MADKLKPCPFCGGEAKILAEDGCKIVMCLSCNASTREFYAYSSENEAIEAWNTRASDWHTGTPTEEGLYVVYYLDDNNPSATPYEVLYDGFLSPDGEGNWIDRDGERRLIDDDIVRWQKITPYKEGEEVNG